MSTQPILSNGICGVTGRSHPPWSSLAELASVARQSLPAMVPKTARAVTAGVDPCDLASAGWGVLLDESVPSEVLAALRPLLGLRQEQAGDRFRVLNLRKGESRRRFLTRHGVGPGPVNPDRIPYYLMVVGDPEAIPYGLQFDLGVQYAVGRIAFDSTEEYARYAESVVAHETRPPRSDAPRAVLFGVENADDHASRQAVRHLVEPLAVRLRETLPEASIATVLREAARKSRLLELLEGTARPDLLFTAGHALLFPSGHERQVGEQGALLCADWPGPKRWRGEIPQEHRLCANDVPPSACLQGLITFLFACYSVGTPALDRFVPPSDERRALAPSPFLARLPQRLLGHPEGGALAVIGHVDRAWLTSFLWDDTIAQITVFETALQRLLRGQPVGHSMECFGQRYAEISTWLHDLAFEEGRLGRGDPSRSKHFATLWAAYHDARNYMIFGDPAVRFAFAQSPS